MTALAHRSPREGRPVAPAVVRDGDQLVLVRREVVGWPADLRAMVRRQHEAGRLVGRPTGRRLPDGRFLVTLTVLEPAPAPRRGRRWLVVLVSAGGVLVAFVVLVVSLVVAWVVAHLAVILGGLVVVVGVLVMLPRLFRGGTFSGTIQGRWR